MSDQTPRILVLGSFSGRNAGDAALLFQIAEDFRREAPQSVLLVPTTHPGFIRRHFDLSRVKPVPILPWNLSLKFLGWPMMKAVFQSRLVLISDNILFSPRLLNPVHNYVTGVVWAALLCRLRQVPMVGYNYCVGPLDTPLSKSLVRIIARSCDRHYVREADSLALLRQLGVAEDRLELTADSAFALQGAGADRGREILRDAFGDANGPWVGLNLCSYLGSFLNVTIQREDLTARLAQAADQLLDKVPARLAIVTTQVMDIPFAREVIQKMVRKAEVRLITNETWTSREIMAVDACMDLFFGMRLHSLILSSAAGTPAIGIAYAPKVKSFMSQMGLDAWRVDLLSFDPRSFADLAARAWAERSALRTHVAQKVSELAQRARQTGKDVAKRYLNPSGSSPVPRRP